MCAEFCQVGKLEKLLLETDGWLIILRRSHLWHKRDICISCTTGAYSCAV